MIPKILITVTVFKFGIRLQLSLLLSSTVDWCVIMMTLIIITGQMFCMLNSQSQSSDVEGSWKRFISPKCQTQPVIKVRSNIWSHNFIRLNSVLYAQGHRHKSKPSRFQVYCLPFPLLCCGVCITLTWHFTSSDHLKSETSDSWGSFHHPERNAIVSERFENPPSYGSDLCLWAGDVSCRFGGSRGRPGLHVPKQHGGGIVRHLRGNQSPHTARLSAAGCVEPHRKECRARWVLLGFDALQVLSCLISSMSLCLNTCAITYYIRSFFPSGSGAPSVISEIHLDWYRHSLFLLQQEVWRHCPSLG